LGLGNLGKFEGVPAARSPLARVGRLTERSEGKDTTTGHWELAGLVTREAFSLYPNGFPASLVDRFLKETGLPGVLGNRAASGTTIIEELGEESVATGKPIVYTSGDSVFQIAAHEEAFGLERLYQVSEAARRITVSDRIGRVIARPFVGKDKTTFKRTEHRRDYSLTPGKNCLDYLRENGVTVCSVGKIDDIFDHRGISVGNHTGNNPDSLKATLDFLVKNRDEKAFVFTNLVDFDQLWGHRRDPKGYAGSLVQLDTFLPKILEELTPEDCLILTSDHGCDPTFRGTDHTREFVPLVAYQPGLSGGFLGDRKSFTDVAASILQSYRISAPTLSDLGDSFLVPHATS